MFIVVVIVFWFALLNPASARLSIDDLIGRKAPEFKGLVWLNCKPITLASLKGKVVLIRFWLIGCPNCEGAVQVLSHLQRLYGKDGLVCIGIHHPKGTESEQADKVMRVVEQRDMRYPVASDNKWATLDEYWTGENLPFHNYTSASFLIDKKGVIRWLHEGGALSLDTPDAVRLETAVKKLVAEKAP